MGLSKLGCRELVEQVFQAKTAGDIHDVCTSLSEQLEFDCFHYGAQIPTSLTRPTFIYISAFPSDWWTRYNEQDYIRVDPVVRHTLNRSTPLVWDCESQVRHHDEDAEVRDFVGDALDFGPKKGVTFPVHGANGEIALLSLALHQDTRRFRRKANDSLLVGQLLCAHIHEAVRRVFGEACVPMQGVSLTARETECLKWTAEGKTTWEVATIMGISERTVIFHLQNVMQKLNVSNRSHAVARAVAQQIVSPDYL